MVAGVRGWWELHTDQKESHVGGAFGHKSLGV